jgi:hypothetical protein
MPCSRRFRRAIPAGCPLRRDHMSFLVEVEHRFRAVQGLASPVRRLRGLPRMEAGDGIDVTAAVGVRFRDDQLTGRGSSSTRTRSRRSSNGAARPSVSGRGRSCSTSARRSNWWPGTSTSGSPRNPAIPQLASSSSATRRWASARAICPDTPPTRRPAARDPCPTRYLPEHAADTSALPRVTPRLETGQGSTGMFRAAVQPHPQSS